MNPLQKIYWIGKGVGWDNVPRRIYQSARIRTGTLRRQLQQPTAADEQLAFLSNAETALGNWKNRAAKFFPIPSTTQLQRLVPQAEWDALVTIECERALNGHYPFFSRWTGELGWPPNFNLDPVNHIEWPVGQHWLDTARSGPPRNDIKLVWEASRLSLAYTLARHFVYTGNEKWADAFWEMFAAWRQQNPLNASVAWGCGQEVAFRLMAALFAAFATLDSRAATASQLVDLERFCYQSAMRIEANINYAQSQKNNHALSEALGLWTVGLLFPNFPQSRKWLKHGRDVLETEIQRQVYLDGSYVQHSMSYHRVMLDVMSWAIALGRINQQELSKPTVERVATAARWLSEFIGVETGRVPNYGANDGANVLPLSCTDYLDYRSSYQLAAHVCGIPSRVKAGAWSEKCLWITGETVTPESSIERAERWQGNEGGYFIMRGPKTQLVTRATTYRDRPGQCDALHVDFWYKQHNVLRDAGSFRYYHEDKSLKDYFYSTSAHNTANVPGVEQMTKGPNFLWLNWPKARGTFDANGNLVCQARFCAEQTYTHTRTISRSQDDYLICDELVGAPEFSIVWNLNPQWEWKQLTEAELVASFDHGEFRITTKATNNACVRLTSGRESLYYGEYSPCPQLVVSNIIGNIVTELSFQEDCNIV